MVKRYIAPFPWFGNKSSIADTVWQFFGDVDCYIEPFFGAGAVLFLRPSTPKIEIINDKDYFVANFWRAVKNAPDEVAKHVDNPVNEADLTARHIWLVKYIKPELASRVPADLNFYDPKVAGWWVWGVSIWLGGGGDWCKGDAPWTEIDGKLVNWKKVLGKNAKLEGVRRKRPHLTSPSIGIARGKDFDVLAYLTQLSNRLHRVKICCGDWKSVVTGVDLSEFKTVGIFFDPPYSKEVRSKNIYTVDDDNLAAEVRNWCVENSNNPRLRIALCGYEGEHNMLEELGWYKISWVGRRAYGTSKRENKNAKNRFKERIWFSPHCLTVDKEVNKN
jgi:DNA adenine methylase